MSPTALLFLVFIVLLVLNVPIAISIGMSMVVVALQTERKFFANKAQKLKA